MAVAASFCRAAIFLVAAAKAQTIGPADTTTADVTPMKKEVSYFVVDTYNHRVMEWKQCATEGTRVAGGKTAGEKLTHLKFPADIAIDSQHHNSLLIADKENHRVVEWAAGATEGKLVVGSADAKEGNTLQTLKDPQGVTISHGNVIVADTGNHRILSCQGRNPKEDCSVVVSGSKYGTDKTSHGCGGYDVHSPVHVEVAHGKYIITDAYYDRVIECDGNSQNSTGKIIAGVENCKTNCYGSKLDELYYPEGTALDENNNYIIADSYNNRIMKWTPGAKTGEKKVTKMDDYGKKLSQLHFPRGIVVDQGDYVIADAMNHRILRWHPGDESGHLVAGGNGFGNKLKQLHLPRAVGVLHHNAAVQACPPVSSSINSAMSVLVLLCALAMASTS